MAALTENSIELPAALLAETSQYAHEANMTLAEIVQEALRNYMELTPKDHARSRSFKQEAAALGLTPEEYSVRLVKEVRAELRAEKIAS